MTISYEDAVLLERRIEKEKSDNEQYEEFDKVRRFESPKKTVFMTSREIRNNPWFDESDYL